MSARTWRFKSSFAHQEFNRSFDYKKLKRAGRKTRPALDAVRTRYETLSGLTDRRCRNFGRNSTGIVPKAPIGPAGRPIAPLIYKRWSGRHFLEVWPGHPFRCFPGRHLPGPGRQVDNCYHSSLCLPKLLGWGKPMVVYSPSIAPAHLRPSVGLLRIRWTGRFKSGSSGTIGFRISFAPGGLAGAREELRLTHFATGSGRVVSVRRGCQFYSRPPKFGPGTMEIVFTIYFARADGRHRSFCKPHDLLPARTGKLGH